MARPRRPWRPQMTRDEFVRGWVFFALYFLVFPFAMAGVQWVFDHNWSLYLSDAAANVLYYLFSDALVFLVFWTFLQNALDILLDYLPENLFALGTGLVGALVLQFVVLRLPYPVENPVFTDWPEQFAYAPWGTFAIVAVLMPIVEEVLFRGLLFGGLRRYSRPLAWVVTVVVFMVYEVWTFAFSFGDARYLLLGFQYLPMALGLTWCYDRGGSIWSPIALHMVLNAVQLFSLVY